MLFVGFVWFFFHADIGIDLFQNQARNSSFHSIIMSQERHTDCARSKVATSAPTIPSLRLIYESPRGMHMGYILPISQPLGLWTRPQRAVFTRNFAVFKTSDSSSRMFMKCLSAASSRSSTEPELSQDSNALRCKAKQETQTVLKRVGSSSALLRPCAQKAIKL